MKRALLCIISTILIMSLCMTTAFADTTSFNKEIKNGPSQQVQSGPKSSQTYTKITLNYLYFAGASSSVSFRAYWAGHTVSGFMTFPTGSHQSNYKTVSGFTTNCTVVLLGSVPENINTYGRAYVNGNWEH